MTTPESGISAPSSDHPYIDDILAERRGWHQLEDLVRPLTPEECLEPGYYRNPDWTVRDVVSHLGTWLAAAAVHLEQISVGTYQHHEIDVDAFNASFLAAMADQPWEVSWVQANAGRTIMLQNWYELADPTDDAAWWIRKSAAEHFAEHLPRLRGWIAELVARRPPDS